MIRSRGWTALALIVATLAITGSALSIEPKDTASPLAERAFFKPALYISSSHAPLASIQERLPNRAAWAQFQRLRQAELAVTGARALPQGPIQAFIDPRSGSTSNLVLSLPLIPGDGVGNQIAPTKAGVDGAAVAAAVREFARQNQGILGIAIGQLSQRDAVQMAPDLWQISLPQSYDGIPVRYGRLVATVSHGNLVLIGTETWGNVDGLASTPSLSAETAVATGFGFVGGRQANDAVVRSAALEIVPFDSGQNAVGAGYGHALVWNFAFVRGPSDETWEMLVDAHSGEVLSLQELNHYAAVQIKGGVYPITSTETCPNPDQCGTLESGWPMPFADTGLGGSSQFTNSAGYVDATSALNTTLSGQFVNISDNCGGINNGGNAIDLGGTNGDHDCVTGGGSAGNTASSRSAFYELNKLIEMGRGWLPGNSWLNQTITANVNLNSTCNAFYSSFSGTVNFYRSGGGCRNTGEIAGVFDHEWGHALDDNDANGSLSNSSEGYADIVGIYRLHASCVGHGFFETSNRGCGTTADGTGFNANEAQVGAAHCDLDCSGVRDADWDKHADHTPDTALGFVCGSCSSGPGPCGRQVHCAAAPVRQAAWDFVTRDLQSAPFNLDNETAFVVGNKVFYQGSGNVGTWYSCSCGASSSGCGSGSGYMQWLAADDDNGNLADGTPHMTAIFNAFDRHGIACATPTPTNGGCGAGPSTAPSLTATPGENQVALSWGSVAGASEYWVFRTEGVAGCDFGKARIAQLAGTSFTDTEVAGDRQYHYNVAAAGSSSACFSALSSCQSVTPTAPPPPPGGGCFAKGASCTLDSECCSVKCKGKEGSKTCK